MKKIILIIVGIIAFIFVSLYLYGLYIGLYIHLFDPKAGICSGMRQGDSYMEVICFDKQYLNDFRLDHSSFLSNINSHAVSVYMVEIIADKRKCSRNHESTANTYFAIREDDTLKEVPQEEVDTFLDSYCIDCLACYSLYSFEPLFEENLTSIWDYKTEGYYCLIDDFGKWYCVDKPVPRINNQLLTNHTIEGIQLD